MGKRRCGDARRSRGSMSEERVSGERPKTLDRTVEPVR
jgi:hypothetical protein